MQLAHDSGMAWFLRLGHFYAMVAAVLPLWPRPQEWTRPRFGLYLDHGLDRSLDNKTTSRSDVGTIHR